MPLLKHRLAEALTTAAHEAQRQGVIPPVVLPEVTIERPQNPQYGDYAANLPLRLARAAQLSPLVIAERLAALVPALDEVDSIEVAAPGFINFRIKDSWWAQQVETVLASGGRYGDVDVGRGARVQVEYVSANPTGPLHVGNGRGAVLGSTLANVLAAAGYQVQQEYYINDAGTQVEVFGRSLYARALEALGREASLPDEGYRGEYVREFAQEFASEIGPRLAEMDPEQAVQELKRRGVQRVLEMIRGDMEAIGVRYDRWFSEQSLYDEGLFAQTLDALRERGVVIEREGALWLTGGGLGENKESVLVRSNGAPTYLATDIAYHYEKLARRGFEWVVDIWGADHQGHVAPLKAGLQALGLQPDRVRIILYQLVNLRRGEQMVRASKRAGEIVTLRELLDEVGRDACRYFFLTRSPDSAMDFDLELAKRQSLENPVYYVQYAHARMVSILKHAEEQGVSAEGGNVLLLTAPPEQALLRQMARLPELVESISRSLEPHHLSHYALELATAFHDFYERCRVVSEDRALTAARLRLVQAARQVLARTLELMGISAPERM